ncbi:MAG: 16S rRNA (uracil(1498)-N(3))-methyltransferase [Betaproteobacteria bacterium]|nr:16S rRNA (uracil(1498)-N(3))-methyltransferase [Betaproteobacteria bacterium]
MQRFFVEHLPDATAEFELPDAVAHHAARVLRLTNGAEITLFDGNGREAVARIVRIDRRTVAVHCEAARALSRESPLRIVLLQGISAADRMDYTLQKSVELGVSEVWPLACARSVVRLDPARERKRLEHWRKLAVSACEQCGRNQVPAVTEVAGMAEALARADGAGKWLLDPEGTSSLRDQRPPSGPLFLLAGPEGGFTGAEEAQAVEAGFVRLRFGPRVMRTETAAVAVMAAMQALWGDC